MKDADVHLLREDGWSLEVLNTLCSLGYELASYSPATCVADFATPSGPICGVPHGFQLHRNETATSIRHAILEAGRFYATKQAEDAFRSALRSIGLKLP
jgi:hypothetical protein